MKRRKLESAYQTTASARVVSRGDRTERRRRAINKMVYGWATVRVGLDTIMAGLMAWFRAVFG